MSKALKTYISLYRPRDHILFTIPLVVIGISTAARIESVKPGLFPLFILLCANVLAMSFAFAINEVEDAEDDKKEKARSNPISRGHLTRVQAIFLTTLAFLGSLALFFSTNTYALIAGANMLILAFFYSYKPIRLKSMPILDLISHSLMLAGLIFLSSYLAISNNFKSALPIFLGTTLISVYGQFFNQIRDYKEDKKAKIKNTTKLVGIAVAKKLMYASAILGVLLLAYAFYAQILPLTPLLLTVIIIPIAYLAKKLTPKRDLRADVATSDMHMPILVLFNTFATLFFLSLYF